MRVDIPRQVPQDLLALRVLRLFMVYPDDGDEADLKVSLEKVNE
jgi:hypothetical protein